LSYPNCGPQGPRTFSCSLRGRLTEEGSSTCALLVRAPFPSGYDRGKDTPQPLGLAIAGPKGLTRKLLVAVQKISLRGSYLPPSPPIA